MVRFCFIRQGFNFRDAEEIALSKKQAREIQLRLFKKGKITTSSLTWFEYDCKKGKRTGERFQVTL